MAFLSKLAVKKYAAGILEETPNYANHGKERPTQIVSLFLYMIE